MTRKRSHAARWAFALTAILHLAGLVGDPWTHAEVSYGHAKAGTEQTARGPDHAPAPQAPSSEAPECAICMLLTGLGSPPEGLHSASEPVTTLGDVLSPILAVNHQTRLPATARAPPEA